MTVGQRLWLYSILAHCGECTVASGAITLCLRHSAEWSVRAAWTPGLPTISAMQVAGARWGHVRVVSGGEER